MSSVPDLGGLDPRQEKPAKSPRYLGWFRNFGSPEVGGCFQREGTRMHTRTLNNTEWGGGGGARMPPPPPPPPGSGRRFLHLIMCYGKIYQR